MARFVDRVMTGLRSLRGAGTEEIVSLSPLIVRPRRAAGPPGTPRVSDADTRSSIAVVPPRPKR